MNPYRLQIVIDEMVGMSSLFQFLDSFIDDAQH